MSSTSLSLISPPSFHVRETPTDLVMGFLGEEEATASVKAVVKDALTPRVALQTVFVTSDLLGKIGIFLEQSEFPAFFRIDKNTASSNVKIAVIKERFGSVSIISHLNATPDSQIDLLRPYKALVTTTVAKQIMGSLGHSFKNRAAITQTMAELINHEDELSQALPLCTSLQKCYLGNPTNAVFMKSIAPCFSPAATILFSKTNPIDFFAGISLSDEDLIAFVSQNPQVTRIRFYEQSRITDEGILELATHCPELQKLSFGKCPQITDAALEAVAANCSELQTFQLEECPLITDKGLQAVTTHCQELLDIRLWNMPQITDVALQELSTAKQLKELQLIGRSAISDKGILSLQTCTQLEIIELSDRSLITENGVEVLRALLPEAQITLS